MEYLHNHRADGLIVLDASLPMAPVSTNLPKFSPHVVFACERPTGARKLISVTVDNHEGAALAIRHLHSLGHERIGHVAGPSANVLTIARREGMVRELQKLGLPVRKEWFFAGDFTIESGARAARQWLAMSDRATAVFCASDQMAFGFISELHRCGVRVPEDVSVVGFDDIEIAGRFIPALTTIRQPRIEIGAIAAEILIRRISGEHLPDDTTDRRLPVELVARDSTGPVRRR
jgi:LacI family repressor for deo operon, udp, cdd, tsx, nupC, and nupG